MAYQSFENLEVWKQSVDLSVRLYEKLCGCRDYGFKDQICRAAVLPCRLLRILRKVWNVIQRRKPGISCISRKVHVQRCVPNF